MPISHLCLALLVVVVWGINFLFVRLGLEEIPPFQLCALRLLLASLPAIFFVKIPTISFRLLLWYGLVMFGLQFSLLFLGMYAGMPAGMASLILQVQVFFSLFFANIYLKEQPNLWQIIGAMISFSGIAVVAFHFDEKINLIGFAFILAAAASWGVGNLLTKKAAKCNMMALVIWGSFVACIPMLFISWFMEGSQSFILTYQKITLRGGFALFYIVYISTWVGYGVWNWLLSRYPVSSIVPFTLLVPIIGLLSSIIVLNEPLTTWKLLAALLVMCGLSINILSGRLVALRIGRVLQTE